MAVVLPFAGKRPVLGRDIFVAETAAVIGDVQLCDGVSVRFGAVPRGDMGRIVVGPCTKVQDQAVLHVSSGGFAAPRRGGRGPLPRVGAALSSCGRVRSPRVSVEAQVR